MSSPLRVSEIFYSLQGEGPTSGTPAVFLRTGGCNLLCGGKQSSGARAIQSNGATWRCDTIEVWSKWTRHSSEDLLQRFREHGFIDKLRKGAHLVVTGGEPLLVQNELIDFLLVLKLELGRAPYVEVETNATQLPQKSFLDLITQFNVSPKLSNSGTSLNQRYCPEVIRAFTDLAVTQAKKVFFKFVVTRTCDGEEIEEYFLKPFSIPRPCVYLMPGADEKEGLQQLFPLVAELCKQKGVKLSSRLHIEIWNRKTGV